MIIVQISHFKKKNYNYGPSPKIYYFYYFSYIADTTVKPVNKEHPREIQIMVFIDKWSLFWRFLYFI